MTLLTEVIQIIYPLVNVQKTMENRNFEWDHSRHFYPNVQELCNSHYQRVHPIHIPLNHYKIQSNHYKIQSNHSKIQSNHYKILVNHSKIQSNHYNIALNHYKIQSNHYKILLNHCFCSRKRHSSRRFNETRPRKARSGRRSPAVAWCFHAVRILRPCHRDEVQDSSYIYIYIYILYIIIYIYMYIYIYIYMIFTRK